MQIRNSCSLFMYTVVQTLVIQKCFLSKAFALFITFPVTSVLQTGGHEAYT